MALFFLAAENSQFRESRAEEIAILHQEKMSAIRAGYPNTEGLCDPIRH
jgi:hypothetical protein